MACRSGAIPLTDPELELLTEILQEDPTAEVLTQVGRELLRRRCWDAAVTTLERGYQEGAAHAEVLDLLARALYEVGRFADAAALLEQAGPEPHRDLEAAKLYVLCLERLGRTTEAEHHAHRFVEVRPDDVVIASVLERLAAPGPRGNQRGADPFYTVERAERYARLGRVDRALRAYQRILLYHPGDLGLAQRIQQLTGVDVRTEDDLSEELVDPSLFPPEPLQMPEPRIVATPLSATPRAGVDRDVSGAAPSPDEVTEVVRRSPPVGQGKG